MTTNNDTDIEQLLKDELTPQKDAGKSPGAGDGKGDASAVVKADDHVEDKTFTLPDGRVVTSTEAQRLWKDEFMPDYTKKSQELAKLQKTPDNKQSEKLEDQVSKGIRPEDQATFNEFKDWLKIAGVAYKTDVAGIVPTATKVTLGQLKLQGALEDLEKDFDGSKDATSGIEKPKVTAQEVFKYITDEVGKGNKLSLTPLQIAHLLHPNEFAVWDAATLGKPAVAAVTKPVLPATENGGSTGGGQPNPPAPKYDYGDGSMEKGLAEFLHSS